MTKTIKKTAQTVKRQNVGKEELKQRMADTSKMVHLKEVVRGVFPLLEGVETIYDAQTVTAALSGFIQIHIIKELAKIKLSDIIIDIDNEQEGPVKEAIKLVIAKFQDEPAKEFSETLEKLSKTFGEFGAKEFLKKPMSEISVDDIVTK